MGQCPGWASGYRHDVQSVQIAHAKAKMRDSAKEPAGHSASGARRHRSAAADASKSFPAQPFGAKLLRARLGSGA
jgi:hypothetical protein